MGSQLDLPDGLVVVSKRSCPTCVLIEPVMGELAEAGTAFTVFSQDDPTFPALPEGVVDDTSLERSYRLEIEAVPTLLRIENGAEVARLLGWNKAEWRSFTGIDTLGEALPERQPGCGSLSVEPGMAEELAVRFGDANLSARQIEVSPLEDEMEACFDRGWSDGLPVVPPTPVRVLKMLSGTTRSPDEIIGNIPPDLAECTVEKVAINAVMAGCKPEYLPVVLAAVEAALIDQFCMHGLLATTWFSGPIVIVNGPIAKRIGMNSRGNVLGQGNRANATIGRALQLVIRNVGGGKPQGVDRATMGTPGKYTFCFAEREEDSPWEPLSVERGFDTGKSTVPLVGGDGVQGVVDQKSRNAASLARTMAGSLRTVAGPKVVMGPAALLVVSPEHARIFREAGWSKAQLKEAIDAALQIPGKELITGANGIIDGLPEKFKDKTLPKFKPGELHIVHAGGNAGLFSAIIGGWVASGSKGSQAVTKEIGT